MEIKITTHDIKKAMNTWTLATATIDGKTYRIRMVRFDEPSMYGIRSGRISKLFVAGANADHNIVINYDRGWDIRPKTAETKALLAAIVKQFN